MGILGLWKHIKLYAHVNMKKFNSRIIRHILVDCGTLVHKLWHALAGMITKYSDDDITKVYTRNLMTKLAYIKNRFPDADMTFIFDGKMPANKRIKSNPNIIDVPSFIWKITEQVCMHDTIIHAPEEADTTICSMLNQDSINVVPCSVVYTDDSDLFYYGARYVMNISGDLFDLALLLREYKMSMSDFRKICHVAGNDYNDSSRQWSHRLLSKYSIDTMPTKCILRGQK